MTNHDQIIVVTEEKKKRRGLVWVAAGAAVLLAGGSTFALWSASDSFTGGTITAGDLNIVQTADTSFWDVSADREDATDTVPGTDGSEPGHSITSIADWRLVPGDKVAATFSSDVTLQGDNLVARLGLDGLQNITVGIGDNPLTYTYEVYSGGSKVVSETALPTTADAPLLYLSADGAGQAAGVDDHTLVLGGSGLPLAGGAAATSVIGLPAGATTADLTVVVYAVFDTDTPDREDVTAADVLPTLELLLTQVRDTGSQFS